MVTPFTADGSTVAADKIKPICDLLISQGAGGLFVCGTTGEGPLMTSEEKLKVIEATVQAVDGRIPVIAQAACSNPAGTIKTARIASKMGIRAVSLLQPWFYQVDEEALYLHLAQVAEALEGFPLFLYNIPGNSGNNLPEGVLTRLLEKYPNVCGIKESGTVENIDLWLKHQSDRFQVICGIDTEVCNSFKKGGRAIVSSTANIQTRVQKEIFDAANRGNWDEAYGKQDHASKILGVLGGANLIAGVKEYYRIKGIDIGGMRRPLRELTSEEKKRLRQGLQVLGHLG